MVTAIRNYFAEFKVLKTVGNEFWLVQAIILFYMLSYFSLMNVFTLYLTSNCGFSDIDSGAWVGIFTLYVTAFVFAVGSICDTIGVRKSFMVGSTALMVACSSIGMAPTLFKQETAQYVIMGMIVLLSFGTAFMTTSVTTSVRRFTNKDNRATGFNVYYLVMNIGAMLAGFAVTDGFRGRLGDIKGNMAVVNFGFLMAFISCCLASFINEENCPEENKVALDDAAKKRPLAIFMEVWKEKPFQKLVLFLLIAVGVRIVFTNQFLVMPKYYTRVLFNDFELGMANSVNPIIIVLGLIVLIPIINKYDTFKLMILGMTISAMSLMMMALPIQWILRVPGIHNLDQAYYFVIFSQIILFSLGELMFSPRFAEYTASVAPKDKVASYMSLAALPMFIAKPINGFMSGILIANYSYEGIRAKIDTHNVSYTHSPEYMWLIYFLVALLSPFFITLLRNFLQSGRPGFEETPEPAAAE